MYALNSEYELEISFVIAQGLTHACLLSSDADLSMPNSVSGILLVFLIVVGASFAYYFQSSSSALQSNTQDISSLSSTVSQMNERISSMNANPSTFTVLSTLTESTTTTLTSVTTKSITYFPIPENVTVIILGSGQFENYAINAGSYMVSGSLSGEKSFLVNPVYQNETIRISISLNCPGSTGPTGGAYLYINSSLVSQSTFACGGNTIGQISYIL